MDKIKQFFGIDISKDVFDVVDHVDNHYQFKNDVSGFRDFSFKLFLMAAVQQDPN